MKGIQESLVLFLKLFYKSGIISKQKIIKRSSILDMWSLRHGAVKQVAVLYSGV